MNKIKKLLGIANPFHQKLLRIEELTNLSKKEATLRSEGKLDKFESLSEEDLPGSMSETPFKLRSLLSSLSEDELKITKNYMNKDFWFPSKWSAGDY